MSYVYLIASDHAVKIGVSNSPERRLVALQTAHYEKLDLIYSIKCVDYETAYAIESALHGRYFNYQLQGEWFAVDPNLIISDIRFAFTVGKGVLETKLYKAKSIEFPEPTTESAEWQPTDIHHDSSANLQRLAAMFIVFIVASVCAYKTSMGITITPYEIGFYGSSSFIAIWNGLGV